MRRPAHVLGAAGEDELGLAELDLLRSEKDRLEARSAETIDRQRRDFLRHAGLEADVTRQVDGAARCLQHVAEYAVIYLPRVALRALERGLRRDHAEVRRGRVAQTAAERAEWEIGRASCRERV